MLDAKLMAVPTTCRCRRYYWLSRPTRGFEKYGPVSQRDGGLPLPEWFARESISLENAVIRRMSIRNASSLGANGLVSTKKRQAKCSLDCGHKKIIKEESSMSLLLRFRIGRPGVLAMGAGAWLLGA